MSKEDKDKLLAIEPLVEDPHFKMAGKVLQFLIESAEYGLHQHVLAEMLKEWNVDEERLSSAVMIASCEWDV